MKPSLGFPLIDFDRNTNTNSKRFGAADTLKGALPHAAAARDGARDGTEPAHARDIFRRLAMVARDGAALVPAPRILPARQIRAETGYGVRGSSWGLRHCGDKDG
jgi:hypothetical protein